MRKERVTAAKEFVTKISDIPEDVLRFIVGRIDSVSHLEALLLLWENFARDWSDDEVSIRIYVSRERAGAILADLLQHGFVMPSDRSPLRYKYSHCWDDAQIIERVSSVYRRRLVHVANLIHSKSPSESVLQFADAFRLKKDD